MLADTTFDWSALVQSQDTPSASSVNLSVITADAATSTLSVVSADSLELGSGSTILTDMTVPVVSVTGNNPATVSVGTVYSDMGATVTDADADGTINNNLGLHFNVDGIDMPDVVISTTASSSETQATTTHTIIYSAVDGAGNWGYATRTVNVIH